MLFQKTGQREVEGFVDADWAGSVEDSKSTIGCCTKLWGKSVTWRSKKQTIVDRSSAEAEYRAIAQGVCELIWLSCLMKELQVQGELPMRMHCDNKAAISIAHDPAHHDRTKHVEVDRHFIKEKIEDGIISLTYVPTRNQTTDILTKGLSRKMFESLLDKMGMYDLYNSA